MGRKKQDKDIILQAYIDDLEAYLSVIDVSSGKGFSDDYLKFNKLVMSGISMASITHNIKKNKKYNMLRSFFLNTFEALSKVDPDAFDNNRSSIQLFCYAAEKIVKLLRKESISDEDFTKGLDYIQLYNISGSSFANELPYFNIMERDIIFALPTKHNEQEIITMTFDYYGYDYY